MAPVFAPPHASRRLVSCGALAGAAVALAACAGAGRAASAPPSAARPPACAAGTQATVATADAQMMSDIYRNQLAGTEVSYDLAQITGAADLIHAVSARDPAATRRAVTRLVYHPAWHIVRLRVLDGSGRLLGDLGGPYVAAPVSGVLRSGGRVVGRFVMSVQDDVGETKLETRFVGDPIGIYASGRLVAERGARLPSAAPAGAALTVGGVTYRVTRGTFNAFPTGTFEAVILVAPPAAALRALPCETVRADEVGRVGVRFAKLAVALPQHYVGYAVTTKIYTGAEIFVRSGARQLASTDGAGPPSIPAAGRVAYQGRAWLVYSFEPEPRTRVYMLIAPS